MLVLLNVTFTIHTLWFSHSCEEGAFRLRGGAKALDIWRVETKLELLFAEIFAKVRVNKLCEGGQCGGVLCGVL